MLNVTDAASVCAFKLKFRSGDVSIGVGTGSLLIERNVAYLVTARHNFTGRNAFTAGPISTNLPPLFPSEVCFQLPYEVQMAEGSSAFDAQPCTLRLYAEGEPVWRVHFPEDLLFDIAVINLHEAATRELLQSGDENDDHGEFLAETSTLTSSSSFATITNKKSLRLAAMNHYLTEGFNLRVGDDLFVLGFPRGIEAGSGLPIWKRATVASEPNVPVNGLPIMLIDIATREGMSGGPVIARQTRGSADGKLTLLLGDVSRFAGIYTSRNKGGDEFEAQVGRVWVREHVIDVIRNGSRDVRRV